MNNTENKLRFHREIMANISEGVNLVRASDGIIVYANPMFEEMFGYEQNELIDKHISIVNAPTQKSPEETANEIKESLNKNSIWRGEVHNIKKDGTPFWCSASISTFNGPETGKVFLSVHTDITKRKKAETDLLNIANGVSSQTGESFFTKLTEHLSNILESDYAYIAAILPSKPNHARTLSLMADGKFIDNIEVNLEGTPCETLLDKDICSYPANVQKLFPNAGMMAQLNVESYVGIPLRSSSGNCIGLMSVMYRESATNIKKIETLLRIFASRASSEIERKRIDDALQNAIDDLETRVQERTRDLAESNTALKVLLRQRVEDQEEFEHNILSNIRHLIMPYLTKLKNNNTSPEELTYISLLESNLQEIVAPFSQKLSSKYLNFTHKEIQIADLIKDGGQDKDIMDILNISLDTVKTHRRNIRKKLDINNKKINLRTKLLSFS